MKKKSFKIFTLLLTFCTLLLFGACQTSTADEYLSPEKTNATSELSVTSESETTESADESTTEATTEKASRALDQTAAGDMTVHFLDVGQGLSILVQSEGETLIYDGGDRDTSSFVVQYLKDQQISTIDYLISSHYDSDHVNGLIGCLNAFNVERVICSDYVHDSTLYDSFTNAVTEKGLEPQHPEVGTTYPFGSGQFTILAPKEIDPNDSNDNSVAIKLTNGENSFIFTGDAESSSEADMIASGIDLSCDVLCLGHHGSASSTSSAFLMETVPYHAVISCGSGNSYGHPHEEVMEYLSAMEIPVFRTDMQGTIIAVSDGSEITWNVEPCNDYSSGDTDDSADFDDFQNQVPNQSEATTATDDSNSAAESVSDPTAEPTPDTSSESETTMVWLSATGEKYHSIPNCGRMNPDKARQVTLSDAIAQGYDACSKCF